MKVFFNASLTGKKDYAENYLKIKEAIEKSGKKIVAAPVFRTDKTDTMSEIIKTGRDHFVNYYTDLQEWIRQADICVFEVSYPSTSIGHEIAMALHGSKPVIALKTAEAPENIILRSINDDRLQLIEYSPDNLGRTIKDAIEYAAENMDTRFNFFISPSIGNYLDWISKVKKVPRAVFLRQLIEEDMKNSDFTS